MVSNVSLGRDLNQPEDAYEMVGHMLALLVFFNIIKQKNLFLRKFRGGSIVEQQ
jgi:hypothetical protein